MTEETALERPALFDTGVAALLLLSPDGTVAHVSRGWSEIFAWPADEAMGHKVTDLCAAEHAPRFDKALRHIGRGAPSAVVRARFLRRREGRATEGATPLQLSCRLEPLGAGVLLAAEDTRERQVVVQGRSTLQTLVDLSFDTWLVHDLDGRLRDANRWASESLGYTREELLSMHVADFEMTMKPGRLDGVWNRMEVGRPVTVEGRHRRKDGSEFPVEVRLGIFVDEHDEGLMLAVCRDITLRKQTERRLEELNAELATLNADLEAKVAQRTEEVRVMLTQRQGILDHLVDGLVAVDTEGRIAAVNPRLVALLGLDEGRDPGRDANMAAPQSGTLDLDALEGQPASDLLPEHLVALLQRATDRWAVDAVEVPLPDGRVGLASVSPILGDVARDKTPLPASGTFAGAVLLLRDITLEKEVDRMKTDFITTVSHELRTPLTSVLGFAKMIDKRLEDRVFPALPSDDRKVERAREQVRRNLAIIVHEGERLTRLISDVLDISRMESGRVVWARDPVEPQVVVDHVLGAAQHLLHREPGQPSPVQLSAEVDADLPALVGDADRLEQVLLNLVSNAAKFTTAGRVDVRVQKVPGGIEWSVSDTGPGIPEADRERIFDRFHQVRSDTLTDKPEGTGLGLAISAQIVAAHHGEIGVEPAEGGGARFWFRLPAVAGLI